MKRLSLLFLCLIMIFNNIKEVKAYNEYYAKSYIVLEKEETKVWQYSSFMLAELFNEERSGRLVLPEV